MSAVTFVLARSDPFDLASDSGGTKPLGTDKCALELETRIGLPQCGQAVGLTES